MGLGTRSATSRPRTIGISARTRSSPYPMQRIQPTDSSSGGVPPRAHGPWAEAKADVESLLQISSADLEGLDEEARGKWHAESEAAKQQLANLEQALEQHLSALREVRITGFGTFGTSGTTTTAPMTTTAYGGYPSYGTSHTTDEADFSFR